MRLSDETLRGRTVIASDGLAVGQIGGLFLDSDTWQVQSFQVLLRKEAADRLGVERTLLRPGTLEVSVAVVQSVGDAVVLSVSVDALRAGASESAPSSAH